MEPFDRPPDRAAECCLLIIGSRRLLCQGLEALFRRVSGWHLVCAVVGAEPGIQRAADLRPDVVLIDLKLPDGGALAAARAIRLQCPKARLLFLDETFHECRVHVVVRLRGAGYFTQDDSFEALLDGVRRVARGGSAFCAAAEPHLVRVGGKPRCKAPAENAGLTQLTRRELEVLALLAQGLTVKECAGQLHISASTADNHKSRLMHKLDVHKVVDLVHLAIREGLLERPEDPDTGARLADNEGWPRP